MTVGIIPVKTLSSSKSRLVAALDRAAVERLSLAMMADVIDALARVPSVSEVVVTTPDDHVAEEAKRLGARPLLRPDPNLNTAVENAAAEIVTSPEDGALVVLGDVACASARELAALVGTVSGRGVALAPSSDGGTSALYRAPFDVIPARFGADSAKRHREEAQRAVLPYHELALPTLSIDIDVAEDLQEALRAGTLGPRTREALRSIGVEGA